MARFEHNLVCLLAAVILILGVIAPRCASDAPPSGALGVADSIGGVTDVLVGHNNRGPYYLTWTNFSPDFVSVVVNGRILQKGADYNVDPAKGVISFNSIVASDAIVRVSYQTQPGKSQRAAGGANIPISLSLRSSDSGSLSVTGMYIGDGKNPDAGKSIIGIGGDRKWGLGKLNSQFLVSQSNDSSGSKGGMWDRAAMKLGGDTSLGMFKFSGSYLHAGESFAGGKEYGTGVGKDIMSFATAVAPAKSLAADASYTSTEDTAGATKGNRNVTNVQNMAFTPIDSTKLTFSHTTNELTNAAGHKSESSSSAFNFTSTAIKRVSLRSSMTSKYTDAAGQENAFSAGMTAKPIDQVTLDIGYGTLENKTVGQQVSTNVNMSATPVKQVAVQAAVGTLDNKVVGQQTSTSLSVQATPIKEVAVQAAYSGVDSTVAGQATKTNVAIQATPIANMQIKASAADSVVNSTRQFQRDISITGTPARFAKFMAMFSQKGVNSLDDVTEAAQVELTPMKDTRFAAGYKYAETGPKALTIFDYSAQAKPLNFMSFSGSYRQRDMNTVANAPDSAAVSVSLSPAKIVAITGEYQGNPEDKNGAVQNFNSTCVGLKTQVGSVGVETNYLQKDEYLADKLSDERKLSLALPVFGHGKLTTGCKFGRTLGAVEQSSRTYLLGYSHSIGSDFSLSFTGYYTQYLQTKMTPPGNDEVSAEASLGAKF